MRECRLTITEPEGEKRGSAVNESENLNMISASAGVGGGAGVGVHVTKHMRLSVPNDVMPGMGRRNSARSRRRRAVGTQDYKSCALVQTRLKFGDIM